METSKTPKRPELRSELLPRNNRKFINKKNDVIHSFKVVQRSQKDPLVADEAAPQGVLIDTECSDHHKDELHDYGVYFDDEYNYLQHLRGVKEAVDWEDCDLEVYTIRKEDPKLSKSSHKDVGLILPSSAFESFVEEPIGLLNRAAPITGPRPELDPDVVAELDREDVIEEGNLFSPEDEDGLPDNFVSLLNSETAIAEPDEEEEYVDIAEWLGGTDRYDVIPRAEGAYEDHTYFKQCHTMRTEGSASPSDTEEKDAAGGDSDFFVSDDEGSEGADEVRPLPGIPFRRGGAKSDVRSRISASSSTVHRTEQLTILDERHERKYKSEYTDDQIGGLDGEVIEGQFDLDSEVFKQAVRATEKQLQKKSCLADIEDDEKDRTVCWVKENMSLRGDIEAEGEGQELVPYEVKVKPEYDCESFVSAFATTRNRPRLIDDSHLFAERKAKLTKRALRDHDRGEASLEDSASKDADAVTLLSCISAVSFRPKDESTEERRERKGALKELRRERRKEKKLNQLAFKEELKRQKKVQINNPKCRIVPTV